MNKRVFNIKVASTRESVELIELYEMFSKRVNLGDANVNQCYFFVNKCFAKWKECHHNPVVRSSIVKFSKTTLKCLRDGFEMPQIGFGKMQILKFFC